MKIKLLAPVIAVITLCSFAYLADPDKDIQGKWKIDPDSLEKTTRVVIDLTRKNNPDLADQMESNFDAVKEMISTIEYEYNADHTYTLYTPQGEQKGKWEIADNGRSLLISPEGRPARKDSILEVSATRLRIINRERGDTTLFARP